MGRVKIENDYKYRIIYNDSSTVDASKRIYYFSFKHDFFSWYKADYFPDIFPGSNLGGDAFIRWVTVVKRLEAWLNRIVKETNTPDLWAEAAKTAQLFALTATPSDDKFTRTELAEVQGQLRLLQQSFTTAALPEAARQKLIELAQTAAVKAEGLTKKDWQNWIIGGFISAITALALNPTQASEVLKLVKAVFGGLFLH